MEIIPVIYILDGRCVALYKGDYGQKAEYSGSPLNWAEKFIRAGAGQIYLADVNARRDGVFTQEELFKKLVREIKVPVIVEAAFPDVESVGGALAMGAARVVLRSPSYDLAQSCIEAYGSEKIMVQIFAKRAELIDGRIKRNADDFTDVVDYAEKLIPLGVKEVVYKDRRSEGILTHPNYDEIDRLYLTCGKDLHIYSSGGISDVRHLLLLKKTGAYGAIVGKAFFEGILGVDEAIEAVA